MKCNSKLLCHHELMVMNSEISEDNEFKFTQELLLKFGVLDSTGIVCKHCGKFLKDFDPDDFEGFTDGLPIFTREQLADSQNEDITIDNTINATDKEEAQKILE